MIKHVGANWFHHTLVSSMITVNLLHSIASIVASLDCSATGYPLGQLIDWLVEYTHNSSKLVTAV